ncbi:MAG: hypothetical protein NT039_01620 [Candidatus Berkelbacteria bacterium]|nr:hypothetical protein [Candidatus Berkelbacteria bacterium]
MCAHSLAKGGETAMAKKKTGPVDRNTQQLLQQMVELRGERVQMGKHWEAARNALGQARWYCEKRDVSPDIAEMRRQLGLAGKNLDDIGTTEAEITKLLASNRGFRNPAKSAQTYAKTVARALKKGNLRSARMSLTQLERNLSEAGLDLQAVDVTQEKYKAWCDKLRPPKKPKATKTKS